MSGSTPLPTRGERPSEGLPRWEGPVSDRWHFADSLRVVARVGRIALADQLQGGEGERIKHREGGPAEPRCLNEARGESGGSRSRRLGRHRGEGGHRRRRGAGSAGPGRRLALDALAEIPPDLAEAARRAVAAIEDRAV